MQKKVIQGFPASNHDHAACVDNAIETAETICRERGERFTRLRREILELIWRSHRPVKAYDLLETISGQGRRASPPTVYRTLDFLQSAGLVHKLESINAYIGCAAPGRSHTGQFLICTGCGAVAELADEEVATRIREHAARLGFTAQEQRIEVSGTCRACRPAAGKRAAAD